MLFSDPKWGNGCLVMIAGVAAITLVRAAALHYPWLAEAFRSPIASLVYLLILLALVRFILNQIFD